MSEDRCRSSRDSMKKLDQPRPEHPAHGLLEFAQDAKLVGEWSYSVCIREICSNQLIAPAG